MYYLPIYVNNRRMHVVKMERVDNNSDVVLFNFIVNSSDNYDVFSLPAENLQLICDNNENIELNNSMFLLKKGESKLSYKHCDNVPVFNIDISISGKRGGNIDSEIKNDGFQFNGALGNAIDDGDGPLTLQALLNGSRPTEYILQFTFNNNNYDYVGAIRICETRGNDTEIFSAALDFGSEASQVGLSNLVDGHNMNIRDAFIKMLTNNNSDINNDYWQGRKNDNKELYKSTYFINKEPGKTLFGEITKNDDSSFLRCLMPINTPEVDLQKYYLLPNLKLIEQLNVIQSHPINFKDESFMGNARQVFLTDRDLHEGILRQILCNFLAVIMYSEQKKYIRFTLLVPNVYSQEKVHKLVEGLYDDFYILKKNGEEKYKKLKEYVGIEINIVSESDASFFGMLRGGQYSKSGAHYMVIDAGKGTTDFSIVHQEGDDILNYNSIYRSGIPASGHLLTYAIYESIRDYYYGIGENNRFNDIISKAIEGENASSAAVLEFVSILEDFKAKSESLEEKESNTMLLNEKVRTLRDLNTVLKNVLKEELAFPGLNKSLNIRIGNLRKILEDSILEYTKVNGIECENVFLTGRAFMLKPFRDSIVDALLEYKIVENKSKVIFRRDCTKTICTKGALDISNIGVVNKGSNALGTPHLKELYEKSANIVGGGNIVDRIKTSYNKYINNKLIFPIGKFIRMYVTGHAHGVRASISYDFFYEGLKLSNVRNAIFTLCDANKVIGSNTKNDLNIYYVGDGYIYKHGRKYGKIASYNKSITIPDDIRNELLNGSIFPFNKASFNLKESERSHQRNIRVEDKPSDDGVTTIETDLEQ